MSNLRTLSPATRRLEDLPSDGGRTVDVLAGGMLRLFVKFEELKKRIEVLERDRRPQSRNSQVTPRS